MEGGKFIYRMIFTEDGIRTSIETEEQFLESENEDNSIERDYQILNSTSDYKNYCEILDHYFGSWEPGYLMSSIGGPIYLAMKDLFHPRLPSSKTLNDVSDKLSKQFGPENEESIYSDITKFEKELKCLDENVYELRAKIVSLSDDAQNSFFFGTNLMMQFLRNTKHGQIIPRMPIKEYSLFKESLITHNINPGVFLQEDVITNKA